MAILIFSEENDVTSDIVCAWINHISEIKYFRLNQECYKDIDIIVKILNNNVEACISNKIANIDLSQITITWFRRGFLVFPFHTPSGCTNHTIKKIVLNHLTNEETTLKDFLYFICSSKKSINHPNNYNCNKLIALTEAQHIGLSIPSSTICRNQNDILSFIQKHPHCISKNIQDLLFESIDNNISITSGKIAQIKTNDISEKSYWYSLFQQEIPKKYELRVFYFLGKMYAMAIFSQMDAQSKLDFRDVDVNGTHPNRMVPYRLPKDIKLKLHKLMKKLHLESGSIDIIVTPDNDFVFLEVNPVGQFNFVSELCNYHIEKDIAKYLAK